ncbi:Decarboxylase orsB, partial [Fulvia fulva]
IAANPFRFSGFAALPMAFPKEAAVEPERAVKDLGLVGAMIDNHLMDGTYYDNETFWPVFETAERLDVPIYLHPSPPSPAALQQQFAGNYPTSIVGRLGASAWG